MKNSIIISILSLIVVFIVLTCIKKYIFFILITDLKNKEYDRFYKKIHSLLPKLILDKLTITEILLNAAILQNKKEEINLLFIKMDSFPFSTKQKWQYYMKAFNYYISISDKKNAFKYLTKINQYGNKQMKLESNRIYNIYILKSDIDLYALLEEISRMEDFQKGIHEYLVSLIYKNKKDFINYEKYTQLSKTHLALLN